MGNAISCYEIGHWDHAPEVMHGYPDSGKAVTMDMTKPLTQYFISSGHNSYLTGDQLFSASGTTTIEMVSIWSGSLLLGGCPMGAVHVTFKPTGNLRSLCACDARSA